MLCVVSLLMEKGNNLYLFTINCANNYRLPSEIQYADRKFDSRQGQHGKKFVPKTKELQGQGQASGGGGSGGRERRETVTRALIEDSAAGKVNRRSVV